MNCPNDNTQLLLSERQGVEIDYCPQCRGIWLDRGELDKLIEKAGMDTMLTVPNQNVNNQVNNRRYDDDDDDYRDPRSKRKSMFKEMFDF